MAPHLRGPDDITDACVSDWQDLDSLVTFNPISDLFLIGYNVIKLFYLFPFAAVL